MRVVLDRKKADFVIQEMLLRDWRVFLAIVFMGDEDGHGEATTKELAERSKLTILSAAKALRRLVEMGVVQYEWIVHMGAAARFSFVVNKKWLTP